MLVTPRVREEARTHFKCPDLEGAELESQGLGGMPFSHWEKRVFENEAMTSSSTPLIAISRITLAVFEDSGWYQPDYSKADIFTWGRGLGCEFVKKSCLSWMKSNPGDPFPFCTVFEHTRCASDRVAKIRCNLVTDMPVPHMFDYNTGNSSVNIYTDKRGRSMIGYGGVVYADFCPYYMVYEPEDVHNADTRCTYMGNMNYNNYSLEVFSPNARCFELDNGIELVSHRATITYAHTVGCYETLCRNKRLFVKTQGSPFYPCYEKGQLVHIEKRLYGIGLVKMRIVCPSCSELCGDEHCDSEVSVSERIGDPTRIASRCDLRPILMLYVVSCLLLHYLGN